MVLNHLDQNILEMLFSQKKLQICEISFETYENGWAKFPFKVILGPCMLLPDIPAWGRVRKENQEFEATLCYVVRVAVKKNF